MVASLSIVVIKFFALFLLCRNWGSWTGPGWEWNVWSALSCSGYCCVFWVRSRRNWWNVVWASSHVCKVLFSSLFVRLCSTGAVTASKVRDCRSVVFCWLRNEQSGKKIFLHTSSMGFECVGSLHATRCVGVQSVLLLSSIAWAVFWPHPSDFLVLAMLFLVWWQKIVRFTGSLNRLQDHVLLKGLNLTTEFWVVVRVMDEMLEEIGTLRSNDMMATRTSKRQ